jgi:hypothetical protein
MIGLLEHQKEPNEGKDNTRSQTRENDTCNISPSHAHIHIVDTSNCAGLGRVIEHVNGCWDPICQRVFSKHGRIW